MFSEERRQEILKMLEQNGRVFAKDLADLFNLSVDSIRRDLSMMEDEGTLKRTHGGAIKVKDEKSNTTTPKSFGEGTEYENAISKKAVSYIRENQTIFIGGGSIYNVMLKYLPKEFYYTVITNSLEVALYLKEFENIKTYLIGGYVSQKGEITDGLANEFAAQFAVDLCFVTSEAISEKGLSTTSPEIAIFSKTVFNNSKRIIALMEHSKFGKNMFSNMCPLTKIDTVITDGETYIEHINLLTVQGVEVIVANE